MYREKDGRLLVPDKRAIGSCVSMINIFDYAK